MCQSIAMKSVDTISDLFYLFGGTGAMAKFLGVKQSTASEMRRRCVIPIKYWPAIIHSPKGRELMLSSAVLLKLHLGERAYEPATSD